MGKYHVAAPDGREFEIEGDAPPSESDLEQIFGAQLDKPAEPTAGDALDAVFQNSLKTGARIPSDAARSLMDAAVNNAKYPAYQMPEGVGQGVVRRIGESKPVQLLSRPLLDLAPSSESIRSVLTLPFQLAQERAENTPDNQSSPIAEKVMAATPSDKALAVATGATRAVGDMASFFTSPIGIATLGMGALPATAQKGIALAFAAQMASDLPDTANELMSELQKPEGQRDYEKISKLATGGAASTILTGIGMKHGMAETPSGIPTPSSRDISQLVKPSPDSISAASQLIGNFATAAKAENKSFDSFDRDVQKSVASSMLTATKNDKVLDAIVKGVPVDVVNDFTGKKVSPDNLSHYKAMLQAKLSSLGVADFPVSANISRFFDSVFSLVKDPEAFNGTEFSSESDLGWFPDKSTTATIADKITHTDDGAKEAAVKQQLSAPTPSATVPEKVEPPYFAKRFPQETLFQRPSWVEPGSALDKALGELRDRNDPFLDRDITGVWKSLTPEQRQDLAARGWVTAPTRQYGQVTVHLANDAVVARNYYRMQNRKTAKQDIPAPATEAAENKPLTELEFEEKAGVGRGEVSVVREIADRFRSQPSDWMKRFKEADYDTQFQMLKTLTAGTAAVLRRAGTGSWYLGKMVENAGVLDFEPFWRWSDHPQTSGGYKNETKIPYGADIQTIGNRTLAHLDKIFGLSDKRSTTIDKVTSVPVPALEAAQELGFEAKRNDAAGMNTEGMPPEMVAAIREKHGPQIEFTDKRPDSPHPGMTFYMPEDATKEQIVARYQEKAKEFAANPDSMGESISDASGLKPGDTIEWTPNDSERKYNNTARGMVVQVLPGSGGGFRVDILAPLPGDPNRTISVWDTRGSIRRTARADIRDESKPVSKTKSELRRPKSTTEIADEIASRGVDPQSSYGEYVKATGIKPEIDAKEWLKIYRKSLELSKLHTGKGIAASVRAKWATATDQPLGSEAGFINIDPLKDLVEGIGRGVKASIEAVRAAGKEAFDPRKMNDYRRSVLAWSAKLQRSYQESYDAAREIKRVAPKEVDQEGMTNWLQAGGDRALLASRMAATTDKKLKAGYRAALNLTPEQIAVATDARKAYDALHSRGMFYDIIKSFKDNYVTQIWDLKKGPTGGASSRTLRDRFRFSKASTFDSFFDGEQAGYKPKTKSLAKLLPIYIHEMNSVIAARQLVADMSKGVASDGRPLVVPRGAGVSVDDGAGNKATLITPKTIKGDTGDYKTLDAQPAMSGWRWASKDSDGKPVFLKSDLAIHPEAYGKLKNVLGKSAITEWYQSKGSASSAIPKGIVKLLDVGQGEVKRTMLGLFAPFHQVQEGTHAVGHRVNPFFNIPHIDIVNNPAHMDAAKHGLMLQPDRASQSTFMEGFRHSGLVSRIPGIGPVADWYSHYLFHEYIPGLKYKTYEAILGRNQQVFEKELKSGAVKAEDVKVLSAEQANAAYGHLNYADLARNPTMQHIFRLGLLAPDFLEARARFTGQAIKGATGAKVGREQLLALATLAIAQAAGAYIGAKTTDGEWDWKNPFSFTKGNRRYTLRSVPEDTYRLLTDTRAFVYARLNPIIGKGAIQYISGVDWRGQKRTALETTKELVQQPIPLTVKGFLGIGNTPLSEWEQLAGAVGLKISRYSAQSDVYKMVDEFKKNSKDPKLVTEFERHQQETSAPSDYKPLRDALEKDDFKVAKEEYAKLLATKKADLINRAMQPYTVSKIAGTDYWQKHDKPFSGGKLTEQKFVKSLSAEDKQVYERAKAERLEQYKKFQQMLKQK